MRCGHFDTGECRSCTLMGEPHAAQVARAQLHLEELLPAVPRWSPPAVGAEQGFRNRAKMVVGGTVDVPTLGILDRDGRGVDLHDCGLYPAALAAAFAPLRAFVSRAHLVPYDVPRRRGELKHVHVTAAPAAGGGGGGGGGGGAGAGAGATTGTDLMVRFVLRSTEAVGRIRKHLPWLLEQLPHLAVVTVNLLPVHAALLEGEVEVVLTDQERLPIRQGDVTLLARPQGFLQTNTEIAGALYRQAAAWVAALPASEQRLVWDLYCGAGGFALHLAGPGRRVIGVEAVAEAAAAARDAALLLPAAAPGDGEASVTFEHDDATTWAQRRTAPPDVVVVNPPRRGLGPSLAAWINDSGARHVLYSSCNPVSLAADLAVMTRWAPVRGRLFAMFPQTTHQEVLVQLSRR